MNNLGYALTPIANYMAMSEIGQMYDSHFDGGEWSNAAHAKMYPKGLRQVNKIARARLRISRASFNRLMHKQEISIALAKCAERMVMAEINQYKRK